MATLLGLTGGIGSGKGLVSEKLRAFGMRLIDADEVGREIMARDNEIQQRVVTIFGKSILTPDGDIDRRQVATIVFQDAERRRELEELLHPRIIGELWRRVEATNEDVILDVPLLIETGLHRKVDVVVVVYTTREVQIRRIIDRDGISREEAVRRINSQLPLEQKVLYAHYLINNSGSREETREQVSRMYQAIRESITS